MSFPNLFTLVAALASFLLVDAEAAPSGEHRRYLIASSPASGKVMYMRLPEDGAPRPLIDGGLQSPQGLAVDQARHLLYIADPEAGKIFRYGLHFNNGFLKADEKPETVATDVKARWVACDGVGDVYFSDEAANSIQRVQDATEKEQALANQQEPGPVILYSGDAIAQVSMPGGVAVDNFHVYWTNKASGTAAGSLVRGSEIPPDTNQALAVRPLTNNIPVAYGACLSPRLAFFTGEVNAVYGVKKDGGTPELITDKVKGARGCVWDGGGTIFVADAIGGGIYKFPNMHKPHPVGVTKVADFEGVTGLAVVSKARAALPVGLALLVSIGLAALFHASLFLL